MTLRETIQIILEQAFKDEFHEAGELRFEVNQPRDKTHGDFATNLAMVAAKAGKPFPFSRCFAA